MPTVDREGLREALAPDSLTVEEMAEIEAGDPMHPPRPAPLPIPVRGRWYITECESCGWIGSSEQCGDGGGPDHDDIICPVCCLSMAGDAPSEADTAKHGEAVYQRIVKAEADALAQADTAAQAVAERDRLRSVLDFEKRARRVQKERADRLSAEVEARDKALTLLLPFVDFAAGEGQEIVPDPDDATQDMDAATLCEAAARALGFEMGDPDYVAVLAAGHETIRALAAGQDKEGGKPSDPTPQKDQADG